MGSETPDDPNSNRRYIRMMPKRFAGIDVGEVNLNNGACDGRKGISDGDTGMCIGSGVN